jgi:hypothetical protein
MIKIIGPILSAFLGFGTDALPAALQGPISGKVSYRPYKWRWGSYPLGQQLKGDGSNYTPLMVLDNAGCLAPVGAFGCNTKAAQAAYATNAWDAPGAGAFGADSAEHFAALVALVQQLQAALVANGICS